MTPRGDDLTQLRTELGQAVRDVRTELSQLRTELAGTYVTNAGLAGITTAWSTTLEKVELAFDTTVRLLEAQVTEVKDDVKVIRAWGTWLLRIVLGAIVLALLALIGLSAQPW